MGRKSVLLAGTPLAACVGSLVLAATTACAATQQRGVPTPVSAIGHEVGADYKLARWEKIVEYFERLDAASDRVHLQRVGISTEGQPYVLCAISSADTIADIPKYQALQARLADPRLIAGDPERAKLLKNAKTTILVACGLHSNEVAASQMAMELAYQLATGNDPRTREILDNCIILLVPSANPDGNNKIIDWYEKYLGTPYEGGRMPWLYQKYAGHDNNRDWFMLNLKETRLLTNVLYHEWHPTILYDIHQMGNRGPRFFVPPFFDPVNPNVHPLLHQSLLLIGGHMATELQEQAKTGVVFKAIYDNWWQGGNRTTPYRHNIVGILTEAASAKIASPVFQEYRDLRGGFRGLPDYAPAVNFAEPWPGGWWRLRDIVDYELIACKALFTLAARYRDRFVANHLALSETAIKAGNEEPPFAWLVPPDQHDPGAAAHMLEILRLGGIEVHRADQQFEAGGVSYPAGTHLMLAAQPYRPHLKDMMERQEYPDRRQYPGGPAESPYDAAGWTLPLQMGVKTVAVVSPFESRLTLLEEVKPRLEVPDSGNEVVGYITSRKGNTDYAVVNALLAEGFEVRVLSEELNGLQAGSIVVTADGRQAELDARIAELCGKNPARFTQLSELPDESKLLKMTPPRTALYQPWTASMNEGWTRYVLEQFDFPYTSVHNAEIRAGDLNARFDCIIIPDLSLRSLLNGASDKDMPPPYAGGIGLDGAIQLERFAARGGTLVLMDSATALATETMRLPVRNVLKGLKRDEFFCPGSLLRVRVDTTHPLGYGLPNEVAAVFARSTAFELGKAALKPPRKLADGKAGKPKDDQKTGALSDEEIKTKLEAQPSTSVARYSDNVVLLSGWILGEEHIRNRPAVCEVGLGKGRIVLLGFSVQNRGQPHGTFKLLFNAIYRSTLASNQKTANE